MSEAFSHSQYLIRKKFLKLFGATCYISDGAGAEVMYVDMRAFKLKEDISVYTGEDKQTELLRIKARQIIDFSAAYDVTDSATGQKIGVLRRKGLKSSFLQDEWQILDAFDNEIGLIKEDSMIMALIRKWGTNLIPQNYHIEMRGSLVGKYKQAFNPFNIKLSVDFSHDTMGLLDKRLGIAAGVLLTTIEGRQQ